jgi:hypothetical protein
MLHWLPEFLSGEISEDVWAWSAEKHGSYTVQSAYKFSESKASQKRHNHEN